MKNSTWWSVAPAALAMAAALAGTEASAQAPPERARFDFAPVGLFTHQTLQVTVANLRPAGTPGSNGDRIRIFLLDTRGERVADSGIRALPAVQMEGFEIQRDQLPATDSGRVQVRAVVLAWNVNGLPPGPVRSSAEIVSAAGRTVAIVLGPIVGTAPGVD